MKKDNLELKDIIKFFFVPNKNDFNSINIICILDDKYNNSQVYLSYYIEYGIIPYSRGIEKKHILIKKEANIVIPNYSNYSKENEKYFIFFKFNTTVSKVNLKIVYENIIYLDEQEYIILKSGIHTIKFMREIDYYLNITLFNKIKDNSHYSIYKNEKNIEKRKLSNTHNIIYIQEPSQDENIKLKIENEDDILLRVSSEYFHDFSGIKYNSQFDAKQSENILKLKFNTTNYDSKLEYQVGLIDENINIDQISIQKKFYENNLLQKNIIYSLGKEPIETNFSLNDDFIYDKNYTIIAYGKDIYGDSCNYFYFEPKTLFITHPNNTNIVQNANSIIINSNSNNIIEVSDNNIIIGSISSNSNEDTDNIIIKSSITNINETSLNTIIDTIIIGNNKTDTSDKRKSEKSKLSTLVIIFIVLGGILIVGGLSVFLIFYFRKKRNQNNNNSTANNFDIITGKSEGNLVGNNIIKK